MSTRVNGAVKPRGSLVAGLAILLGFQLVGELVVAATGLPVPGPVIGMVLFLGWLQLRRPEPEQACVRTSDALLKHLQLLFVPAGVGVVAHLATLRDEAWAVGVALVGSWLAGVLVVGWIVQAAVIWRSRRG